MNRTPKSQLECEGATRRAWREYQEYKRQLKILHRVLAVAILLLIAIFYIVAHP